MEEEPGKENEKKSNSIENVALEIKGEASQGGGQGYKGQKL